MSEYNRGYAQGAKNWSNMWKVAHNPYFGRINGPAAAWNHTFYCLEWWYMHNGSL